MKLVFSLLANKYMLTLVAFCIWMAFFDTRDIFSQMSRRNELQQLNTKIDYYKGQIDTTKDELKNLKNNREAMEKYAREKYFMKKDNEEIFIEQ